MSAARTALRVLASAAAVLAVTLSLLEAAARLLDPLGISYYPETARYLDTLVIEEPIGYRNRPGLTGVFHGVPVSINALGLRDREVEAKAPGEFRVIMLGDSVPFGIGVRYEDCLPRQLERMLAARRPERAFRVLNFGVPSYNTEQELIQLRTLGLTLAPDALLLTFAPNDIEPRRWVLDKRGRWYVDLAQRSYALALLYIAAGEARKRLGALAPPAAWAADDGAAVGMAGFHLGHPRWRAVDSSLTEINALARARGIPFVLLTIDEAQFIVELLQGVAAREGFALVNLARRKDPRWSGQDEALFRNSHSDAHPSVLGNRVLATLIAEHLERLGIPGRGY